MAPGMVIELAWAQASDHKREITDVPQQRTTDTDWYTCGDCFPVQDTLSVCDFTCFQESTQPRFIALRDEHE